MRLVAKHTPALISTVAVLAVMSVGQVAQAASWVLYDDFSASNIRTSRWAINGQGREANIFVEDGKLVMERLAGATGTALLGIRIDQDKIRGLRATMTTSACDGNLVGSMQTLMGNYATLRPMSMNVRMLPQEDRIEGWVSIERRTSSGEYDGNVRNVFTYGLGQGRVFVNRPKQISINWNKDRVNLTVSREGSLNHTFSRDLRTLDATTFAFHALGVSGTANSGVCRVTFDNVYVFK